MRLHSEKRTDREKPRPQSRSDRSAPQGASRGDLFRLPPTSSMLSGGGWTQGQACCPHSTPACPRGHTPRVSASDPEAPDSEPTGQACEGPRALETTRDGECGFTRALCLAQLHPELAPVSRSFLPVPSPLCWEEGFPQLVLRSSVKEGPGPGLRPWRHLPR